jgi:hypothetical protein
MASLKELITIDEVMYRIAEEKKNGTPTYNHDSSLFYVSINVSDLDITKNVETRLWNMSDFYSIISTWSEVHSKCRPFIVQFVV